MNKRKRKGGMFIRSEVLDFVVDSTGYEILNWKDRQGNSIRYHTVLAEKVLGHSLPKGAMVHHADENPLNNENSNLVICPSQGYHKLLHQRIRAKKACGHVDWLKCQYCKQYDNPIRLYVLPNRRKGWHRDCHNKYQQELQARKKKNALLCV